MTTYSLAVTSASARSVNQVKTLTLGDSSVQGTFTVTIPTPGGMALAMSRGTAFIAKGPDGAERLYRLDAERSTDTTPILVPLV